MFDWEYYLDWWLYGDPFDEDKPKETTPEVEEEECSGSMFIW